VTELENEMNNLRRERKKAIEDNDELVRTREIEEAHKEELTLEGDFEEKLAVLTDEYEKEREELKSVKK